MAAVVQMERPPACQKLQPQTSIATTMLVMVPITGIDVMKAERIDVKNPSIPNQYINPSLIAPHLTSINPRVVPKLSGRNMNSPLCFLHCQTVYVTGGSIAICSFIGGTITLRN